MAFTDSEIQRMRFELGYNVMAVGGEPYIDVTQVFDNVIAEYSTAGASTTSTTAVTAATSYTPVTLTLASATGFTAGCRVVVDVDTRQELATVQSLSGSTITVQLRLAHSGTYPVVVEGGESIVRGILARLIEIGQKLAGSYSSAGIKRVDEVEFFEASSKRSELLAFRADLRNELASALGVRNMNAFEPVGNLELY